jgi:hypothetical protein
MAEDHKQDMVLVYAPRRDRGPQKECQDQPFSFVLTFPNSGWETSLGNLHSPKLAASQPSPGSVSKAMTCWGRISSWRVTPWRFSHGSTGSAIWVPA